MASAFVCDGAPVAPDCKSCAAPLTFRGSRGRPPSYCSPGCFPSRKEPPRPIHKRDCAECGAPFMTANARTVCCSPACGWVRGKRNSDATRTANATSRNTATCRHCSSTFVKTRNAPGLYCSRGCAADSQRKYQSQAEAKRAERQRWKERTGWTPRPKPAPTLPTPPETRLCVCCGEPFTADHGARRYCSARCVRRQARKGKDRQDRKHRDRARKHGVHYEAVNRIRLFERDRWRCQVCGVKTPKRLMGSLAPNAPEMDHRIPMVMGGPPTWANVQCACRRCNGAKGGTIIVGQLPLFATP